MECLEFLWKRYQSHDGNKIDVHRLLFPSFRSRETLSIAYYRKLTALILAKENVNDGILHGRTCISIVLRL